MVGKSPNEVYEAVKQGFNLLVYAQQPGPLRASPFLWTQSQGWGWSRGLYRPFSLIRSERKFTVRRMGHAEYQTGRWDSLLLCFCLGLARLGKKGCDYREEMGVEDDLGL